MDENFPYTRINKNLILHVHGIEDIGISQKIYKLVVGDGETTDSTIISTKLNYLVENGEIAVNKKIKITDCVKTVAKYVFEQTKCHVKAEKQILVILNCVGMRNHGVPLTGRSTVHPMLFSPRSSPPTNKLETVVAQKQTTSTIVQSTAYNWQNTSCGSGFDLGITTKSSIFSFNLCF